MDHDLDKLTIAADSRAKKDLHSKAKRHYLLLAVALTAVVAFVVYRFEYYAIPVEVKLLNTEELGLPPIELTAGGYLIADPQVMVSAKSAGKLREVNVTEGDPVKSGDVLGALDAADLLAQYRESELTYKNESRHLTRMRALFHDGVVAKRELELAEEQAQREQARYESSKFNYESTLIRSPIDGVVVEVLKKAGEFLSPGISPDGDPGSAAFRIGDLSQMKVELDINESDIGKIALHRPVLIIPDALPGKSIQGEVIEIAARADRQKSVVPIKIKLSGDTTFLKPEMSARVLFLERPMQGEIEHAILIPKNVVHQDDGESMVFLMKDERVAARRITIAPATEDQVKVLSGLNVGDILILEPDLRIQEGRRVRIANDQ